MLECSGVQLIAWMVHYEAFGKMLEFLIIAIIWVPNSTLNDASAYQILIQDWCDYK